MARTINIFREEWIKNRYRTGLLLLFIVSVGTYLITEETTGDLDDRHSEPRNQRKKTIKILQDMFMAM
uniref:Uncharacterized protein n=1 Tax=Leersia perrieri TaxID=77586 RepID=A0A0D9VNC6_9ORYZ